VGFSHRALPACAGGSRQQLLAQGWCWAGLLAAAEACWRCTMLVLQQLQQVHSITLVPADKPLAGHFSRQLAPKHMSHMTCPLPPVCCVCFACAHG
jgi:hypothetical protein